MKKLYKILLFILFSTLTLWTYESPIEIKTPNWQNAVIFCLWFSVMHLTSLALLSTREFILFSKQDKDFNFGMFFGATAVTMLLLSISFCTFILSEKDWTKWFALWPILLSPVAGWITMIKYTNRELSFTSVGSFYALPLLSIGLSALNYVSGFDHGTSIIICSGMCLFSSAVFFMKKNDAISGQEIDKKRKDYEKNFKKQKTPAV